MIDTNDKRVGIYMYVAITIISLTFSNPYFNTYFLILIFYKYSYLSMSLKQL